MIQYLSELRGPVKWLRTSCLRVLDSLTRCRGKGSKRRAKPTRPSKPHVSDVEFLKAVSRPNVQPIPSQMGDPTKDAEVRDRVLKTSLQVLKEETLYVRSNPSESVTQNVRPLRFKTDDERARDERLDVERGRLVYAEGGATEMSNPAVPGAGGDLREWHRRCKRRCFAAGGGTGGACVANFGREPYEEFVSSPFRAGIVKCFKFYVDTRSLREVFEQHRIVRAHHEALMARVKKRMVDGVFTSEYKHATLFYMREVILAEEEDIPSALKC